MQSQFSRYSVQLALCDKKQDAVCAHGTAHTEHYAKSLIVNNQISLTAFCQVSLILIFVPLGYIERIGLRLHFSAEYTIW